MIDTLGRVGGGLNEVQMEFVGKSARLGLKECDLPRLLLRPPDVVAAVMIESLRKNIVLVFIVIVILLAGFIFMDAQGMMGRSGGGESVVTVGGQAYSEAEFNKLGLGAMRLMSGLRSFDANGIEIMQLAGMLSAQASDPDVAAVQFFANRMMLKEGREEFGIHPSDDEVAAFIRGLMMFQTRPDPAAGQGAQGEFDQAAYNEFVQRQLGRFGLVEKDFHELIADVIAARELRRILGGGLTVSRRYAEAVVASNDQSIDVKVAEMDAGAFRERFNPSDEDLKPYWEIRRDAYQTEKRIQISYLLLAPDIPEKLQESGENDQSDSSDEADPAQEEENAEENESPEENETGEEKAEREALEEAERLAKIKQIERDLAKKVDAFITGVETSEGGKFEPQAEEHDWEIVTTSWITPSTLPPDFELETRGASSNKELAQHLFSLAEGPGPLARYTGAIAVGENQWLMARLDDIEEVRPMTFEEAREQVREDFIEEKVSEAVRKEAKEKLEALKEALQAGKTMEEAAKAEELEYRELNEIKANSPHPTESRSGEIFQHVATVDPASFADPLYLDDRVLLVRVVKREIIKDDNRARVVDNQISQTERNHEYAALAAWLSQKLESAGLESSYLR